MLDNWMLIVGISLVSFTMLMFLSAYIAILDPATAYYSASSRSSIILFANSFNICYLIFSPLLFSYIKKYYISIVSVATVAAAIGGVGRYLAGQDYQWALFFTIVVGIAHVPIITAPYGLLGLFPASQQAYASSIPLFVPVIGLNVCILYDLFYVSNSTGDIATTNNNISFLNSIIAVLGAVSTLITLFFMFRLRKEVLQCNRQQESAANRNQSFFGSIKRQLSRGKVFLVFVVCWGVILGINWTYGGMFDVIFINTGLSASERAILGLVANVSSALFSNLGSWIANNTKLSKMTIIFILNTLGLIGAVFIQASSSIDSQVYQNKYFLIADVILLRAGFSSFVSLAFVQLNKFGMASVLVSSLLFYIANAANLLGNEITDYFYNEISMSILVCILFVCIFAVTIVDGIQTNRKNNLPVQIQMQTSEVLQVNQNSPSEMQQSSS